MLMLPVDALFTGTLAGMMVATRTEYKLIDLHHAREFWEAVDRFQQRIKRVDWGLCSTIGAAVEAIVEQAEQTFRYDRTAAPELLRTPAQQCGPALFLALLEKMMPKV